MKKTLLLSIALLAGIALQAQVSTFPWTEGFENGQGQWTFVDQDGDGHNWTIYDNSSYAHNGSFSLMSESYSSDALSPDNYAFSPAIALPDEDGFVLEYWTRTYDETYPEHLSVYIATENTVSSVSSLTAVESYEVDDESYTKHTVSLNDYAGQTIYIVFRHHISVDQWKFYIDDVTVRQTGAPMIGLSGPASTQSGVDATFYVTLTEGQTPTYTWTSTMAAAGQATLTAAGDTAVINYSAGGIDTVTVVATNAIGSATATRTVTVVDCGTAASLPWTADLGSDDAVQCWNFVNAGSGSNNWSRNAGNGTPYLSTRGNDTWAVTPMIQMPASAVGTILEYSVRGYNNNSYEVWVAPDGGANVADFTDSLFGETYTSNSYATRTVDLSAYSGQQIRIGFRHTHQGSNNNNMRLRDIGVRQTTVPVIGITGSASVDAGSSGNYAIVVSEGTLEGISYSWSSVMAAAGLATITATDSTASIAYTVGGDDTITATATNAHGTATATYAVHVRECSDITELPWAATLTTVGVECWTFVDNDNNNYNWSRGGNGSNSYLSSRGADDWAITPAIQIPSAGGDGTILEWSVRGFTGCTYEVWVSPTAGTDVDDFTDSLFSEAYTNSNTYADRSVNLGAYAGQTVRFAFRHTGSGSNNNTIRVRGIGVRMTDAPVISISGPTTVDIDSSYSYAIVLDEGSLAGMVYTWNSTMADAGHAVMVETDSTMTITYSVGGRDTITATATNSFGSATATRSVYVRDCSPVTVYPWSIDLGTSAALDCWTILDIDGDGDSWVRNSGGYLSSTYNSDGPDDWLISQPLVLPDEDGYIVSWQAYGGSYSVDGHYQVLVSPTAGSSVADFTDIVFEEVYGTASYADRLASLNAYAGQTIRVAFRHVNTDDDDGMRLRNIVVRQALAPVVDIVGSITANVNVAETYRAILSEGTTEGISWVWTSTMAVAGSATMVEADSTMTITYTIMGHDTISVTATNAYGTNTRTLVVNVVDLSPVTAYPYTTGFESSNTDNASWQIVSNTSNVWTIGNATNNGDSNALYISNSGNYGYSISSSTYAYAYRLLSLTAGEYNFAYDWRCVGEQSSYGNIYDYMRVFLAPSSYDPQGSTANLGSSSLPAGFISLDDNAALVGQSAWTTNVSTVTIAADGLYKMVFYWENDMSQTNGDPAAIDNVSISNNTCPMPANLTATAITANSVSVGWTAGGSETEWVVGANGTTYTTSTNSFTVTGLDANTTYAISVRSVCGTGDTSYAVTGSFRTDCDGGNCSFTVDMADSYGDGWNGNAGINIMQGGATVGTAAFSSGYAASEGFSICAGQPITLSWTTGTFDDECSFTVSNADGTVVYTIDDCSSLNGGEVFLTFDASCNVDGVEPGPGPGPGPGPQPQPDTCLVPTNLHMVSATTTSVSIDWTPTGGESLWQLQVDGGQPVSVGSHPYVLGGLTASTTYSIKVRAVCGSDLMSDWCDAVSVTTADEDNPEPGPGEGIADAIAASIAINPNPASSTVSISAEGLRSVVLVDMTGRECGEWNAEGGEVKVDVGQMARGVYFVRLRGDGFTATRKLVVGD